MRLTATLLIIGLLAGALVALGGCESWPAREAGRGGSIAASTEPTVEQQESLIGAQQAMEEGAYGVALRMFEEILVENPTITTAYLGIGEVYMIHKEYDRAEPAFARACRLEPDNYEAQYNHGLSLQMLGRIVDSIRAYHRALAIEPDSVEANLNIATTYLQNRQPDRAVRFAERAVELDPGSGPARANLGAVYERVGRNAEAIDEYLIASELMETSPELTLNLINALAKERRYAETVNAAENLVKYEPSANAYERLGWAAFKLGDYRKSAEAYRSAVYLDERHWPSQNGVGVNALNRWLLSKREDHTAALEARDAFRRSLRVNPEQPKVISLLLRYNL